MERLPSIYLPPFLFDGQQSQSFYNKHDDIGRTTLNHPSVGYQYYDPRPNSQINSVYYSPTQRSFNQPLPPFTQSQSAFQAYINPNTNPINSSPKTPSPPIEDVVIQDEQQKKRRKREKLT